MIISDLNDLPFAVTIEETAEEGVTVLTSALAFCEGELENGEAYWAVFTDREFEGESGAGRFLEE